jgi:hypothetical protein
MANVVERTFHLMMYNTCPQTELEDGWKLFVFDLHCREVQIEARLTNASSGRPSYEIRKVVWS